ncbi:hypothetical protein [Halogeometricum borinquense]|uniref:hypothetical protein n=1 Tax=Halogeometricum borinquense TaxID=60847 RepID=UPI00139F29B8|nr:hypothetical protein [Halogeometricum borinquense]
MNTSDVSGLVGRYPSTRRESEVNVDGCAPIQERGLSRVVHSLEVLVTALDALGDAIRLA